MVSKNFQNSIDNTPPEVRQKVVEHLDKLDEEHIIKLLKKIEDETGGSSFIRHRLKHKDTKELLEFGDKLLKPMYESIEECTFICIAIITHLYGAEPFKTESVGKQESGMCHMNINAMVTDYKKWYEKNYL